MVLTETHLDGGGVLIAARNTLKIIQRDDIICQSELLFVGILLKHDKLTIGVFYRPPNGNIEHLEDLQNVLSEISTTDILVLGDFNKSEIDWHNTTSQRDSPLQNLLIEIIHDNFFTQMVSQPTRGQNILDLILTTSVDYVQDINSRQIIF